MSERNGYEIFQLCGSFGGTESIARAKFRADYGEGYRQSALFGSRTGLKTWTLKFDGAGLPQMLGGNNPTFDGEEINRADYLWQFWNKYDLSGEPFVFQSRRNGQYYLADFLDTNLTYEQFHLKLWTTGLTLGQRKLEDVSVYDPALTPRAARYYNSATLDYADGSSVTTWPDSAGGDAEFDYVVNTDLTSNVTKPIYKTNIKNGNGIVRFSGTSKPLINAQPFTLRHLFIIAKHSDSAYATDSALISEPGHDILTTLGGSTFYPLDLQFDQNVYPMEAYVNGLQVDLDVIPVPYNTWSLIEIRFLVDYPATGLIVGADHNGDTGTKWKGDIGDVFAARREMFAPDIDELTEELMKKFALH